MSDELRDSAEHPEIVSTETVYNGAVWDVAKETFHYGEGELTRDYVNHPGASAVVAVNDSGEVLLLRQYRHPVRSRNWELPAGLLDVPGEDPVECAHRELAEEADYRADEMIHLSTLNVSPGGSNETINIYLARGLHPVEHDYVKTGEEADLEVRFWPLDKAVDAAMSGLMRNQISVTGILMAHVWIQQH